VSSPDLPLGLVTTISHAPTFVVLGSSNVQVTLDDDIQVTFVAVILVSLERRSMAVRLDTKSDPVISVDMVVPASPSSGSIALIEGLAVDVDVVAVAVGVVVIVVAVVVTAVVTVVGAAVGTDATVTCAIFTVYIFSITVRVVGSVFEFMRYPYDPSVFL
jgi:hypothetical protein